MSLRQRRIVLMYCFKPPRVTDLLATSNRPRMVLMTDSGCSKISFCMKWSNLPFMISWSSSSSVWIARTLEAPSSLFRRWMLRDPSWMWAMSSSSRYNTFLVCSTMAEGSEERKNSVGIGEPSSDKKARDWDRWSNDLSGGASRLADAFLIATLWEACSAGRGRSSLEYSTSTKSTFILRCVRTPTTRGEPLRAAITSWG